MSAGDPPGQHVAVGRPPEDRHREHLQQVHSVGTSTPLGRADEASWLGGENSVPRSRSQFVGIGGGVINASH